MCGRRCDYSIIAKRSANHIQVEANKMRHSSIQNNLRFKQKNNYIMLFMHKVNTQNYKGSQSSDIYQICDIYILSIKTLNNKIYSGSSSYLNLQVAISIK